MYSVQILLINDVLSFFSHEFDLQIDRPDVHRLFGNHAVSDVLVRQRELHFSTSRLGNAEEASDVVAVVVDFENRVDGSGFYSGSLKLELPVGVRIALVKQIVWVWS